MARQMKVTATLEGGQVLQGSGLYLTLADRVAFERRFDVAAAGLTRGVDSETGTIDPELFREEHHAFAAWCLLKRAGATDLAFEAFIEVANNIDLERPKGDEPDPTEPLPQPPS